MRKDSLSAFPDLPFRGTPGRRGGKAPRLVASGSDPKAIRLSNWDSEIERRRQMKEPSAASLFWSAFLDGPMGGLFAPLPRADRDDDLFYQPPGTEHYNVQFVSGALLSRGTARHFEGLKPEEIEWVWMVEARRRATPEEIRKLCAGTKT